MNKFFIFLALWLVLAVEYIVFSSTNVCTQQSSPTRHYHLNVWLHKQEDTIREANASPFLNMPAPLTTPLRPAQMETVEPRNKNSSMLSHSSAKKGNLSNTSLTVTLSQSSLVPDEYNLVDIALNGNEIDVNNNMCSNVLMDPYYKELRDLYMNAWHKFVPKQSEMNSTNCWYDSIMNELPYSIVEGLKKLDDLHGFQRKFDAKKIVNMTLRHASKADNSSTKLTVSHYSHFCIPNIYVIGFHKSGTTLLYEYIKRHPLFAAPHTKESAFWQSIVSSKFDSKTIELGVLAFLYHFSNASIQMRDTPDMFTIDASASTVFATAEPLREERKDVCFVPLLMAETMPKTKILVSMRNPIDRLWSGYLYFCPPRKWKNSTHDQENFLEIVASTFHNQVVDAMKKFHNCIHQNNSLFHCTAIIGSYSSLYIRCNKVRLGIGMYYVHLVKWFSVFPREQIHVIKYDDLAANPSSTVDQVFEFLGISHHSNLRAIQENVKSNGWEKGFKMLPKTRKLLAKFYHPYNVKLADYLKDEDFLWDET